MFIRIGVNIINVNEIVRVCKCVDDLGIEFSIRILVKDHKEEFTVFRSDNMQAVNDRFERIHSILIPES